jgi:hypothetical protein
MKRLIYIATGLLFMAACGTTTNDNTEEAYTEPEVTQKYNYSGLFEIGDRANYDIVRQWNEAIRAKDRETISSLLADSVSVYLWDGMIFDTTKDSLIIAIEGYFETFSEINIIYHAGIAIKSTDKEDDWALSWTTEQYADKEGKKERIVLQENFLIEEGKIRSVRQYAQMIPDSIELYGNNEEDEFTYSGTFVKADDGLKDAVLGWNNALATPSDLDLAATFLADSVTIYMWTGKYINSTKDSVMRFAKRVVSGASNITVNFDALIPVRSTDRNENWVLSWTDEVWTNKNGEEEHMRIHEDYLLENGKIRMVRQYAMKDAPKKEEEVM